MLRFEKEFEKISRKF